MTKPWHMARVASRRELPKPRKMMGPVGERPAPNGELVAALDENDQPFAVACRTCGHDVCDCRSDAPKPSDPYSSYAKPEDVQLSPGVQAYLKYARFCAEQLSFASGFNSVARGEARAVIKHPDGCPCMGCGGLR